MLYVDFWTREIPQRQHRLRGDFTAASASESTHAHARLVARLLRSLADRLDGGSRSRARVEG